MRSKPLIDTSGKFQFQISEDGTAVITNCLEASSELRIPQTLNGYTVTGLTAYAIEHNEFKTISIPKTVSRIDNAVFLSDYIKEIIVDPANPYFRSLNGLLVKTQTRSIVFCPPEFPVSILKIPDGIREIRDYAFSCCIHLQRVILPEGLESIGYEAFENCSNLTDIYIPSSVSHIGDWAFDDCINLSIHIHADAYKRIHGYFREFPDLNFEVVKEKPGF